MKSLFGEAIKRTGTELRMSQEELAERAGLHRTYVSEVERGKRNASIENIQKLAEALDRSISKLFASAGNGSERGKLVEILLIEDNPHDTALTLRALRKAKVTNVLHVVNDGAKVLGFLFQTDAERRASGQSLPGVILLDLDLPKVHGIEVLRRIKADTRTKNIPVIVLTSSNLDRDIAACRQLGVESYIIKPVEFQNLREVTLRMAFGWGLTKLDPGTESSLPPQARGGHRKPQS
jgi:CheY-like chemotaxis protein/predicted XRE-type DNA-binding protein